MNMWECWWLHQLRCEFHGLHTNTEWWISQCTNVQCIWRQIWSISQSTVRGDQTRSSKSSVLASGGRWGFNSSPQRFEQERPAILIDIRRSLGNTPSLGPIERQYVPNKSITNPMSCGKGWQNATKTTQMDCLQTQKDKRTAVSPFCHFISAKVQAWNLVIMSSFLPNSRREP